MSEKRPLVAVNDDMLLDEVLRIAAATACAVERVPDPHAARTRWTHAPMVVLDESAMAELAAQAARPRGLVVVVCAGHPGDESWKRFYEFGVERVVALPDEESELVGLLADLVDGPSEDGGKVLATIGARGGAGASVFAAAAAVEVARAGGAVLLVDCDPLAGGLDLVLGAEQDAGLRWPELSVRAGRLSMSALVEALPSVRCGSGRLVLLSCGRDGDGPSEDGIRAVMEAGCRAGYTVICDLPRAPGAVSGCVLDRADLVGVLVPAEVRAGTAARGLVATLSARARRVGLIVRGPAPDGLSPGAIGEAVGAEVLTVMRAEPKLAKCLDRAEFAPRSNGPLAGGARAVLEALWWDESVSRLDARRVAKLPARRELSAVRAAA